MCGIAGFISNSPKYNARKATEEMLSLLRHRGPNYSGVYEKGNVALGMARLSIIDKQKYAVPIESADGAAAIAYNGEIYNHQDIRGLMGKKYSFKTSSDAETALYYYLEKGVKSFKDYNGMYAFAIYDSANKELYLVRDKAGEKPLYYVKTDEFFAFASEIKALLKLVEPEFNKGCLSYEAYEFNTGEETVFRHVYCLAPGEYIKVDRSGNVAKHSYWKIWDNLIHVPDNLKRIENSLGDLLFDAIRLRTKNCVHQLGVFVSGGVDSALVACIAKPDFIYTCHYPIANDFDELEYAYMVAKKIKRDLIIVQPTPHDFQQTREKIIYHLDTPCTWTSFSLWMLAERAHKDVRVVLSGDGADELFSGYYRYHLLHHDEQIRTLKALERYSYMIDRYYGSAAERYARLVNRCENRYNTEVLGYLNGTIGYYFSKMKYDYIHAMGAVDFYTSMQELLQFADRINMAYSIENRSPFLDHRLIQFAFSMPSKYKIKNGVTKWIIKRFAGKFIPRDIIERVDKRGFSAPVNQWFGWGTNGKYDRSEYRKLVFGDWVKVFNVKTGGRLK